MQSVETDGIQGFHFGNQEKMGDKCLATVVHRVFENIDLFRILLIKCDLVSSCRMQQVM